MKRLIAVAVLAAAYGCGEPSQVEHPLCRARIVGAYAFIVSGPNNAHCDRYPCRLQVDVDVINDCDDNIEVWQLLECGEQSDVRGPDPMHAIDRQSVSGELVVNESCAPSGLLLFKQQGEFYSLSFATSAPE